AQSLERELSARLEHLGHVGAGAACPTCEAPLGTRLPNLLHGSRTRLGEVAAQAAAAEATARDGAQHMAALRAEQRQLVAAQQKAQHDAERLARLDADLARERAALADLEGTLPADP